MGYIYKVTNTINNKCYIGQTVNSIENRIARHISEMNCGSTYAFHNALRKYGKENFTIECLEECDSTLLNEKEKYWIKQYDSYYNGYNETLGGDGHQKISDKEILSLYDKYKNLTTIENITGYDRLNLSRRLKTLGIQPEQHHGERKVAMIDKKSDKILEIFNTQTEAAEEMIKRKKTKAKNYKGPSSGICKVCQGQGKTAFGYKWKYLD